jgi:hypothetical protein
MMLSYISYAGIGVNFIFYPSLHLTGFQNLSGVVPVQKKHQEIPDAVYDTLRLCVLPVFGSPVASLVGRTGCKGKL